MGGLGSLPFTVAGVVAYRNPTPRTNRTAPRVHAQAILNALPLLYPFIDRFFTQQAPRSCMEALSTLK